jgi:hypothetical protein
MFKHIISALFLSALAYQPVFAQKQAERFFDNTVGLVDRYSKIASPQNSASDINNIMFDDRGQLSKRQGYTKNNTAALSGGVITGIGYSGGSSGFFAVVAGSQIFRTGNTLAGSYTNVTSTVTITNASTNLVSFTNFNGELIGCNESDPPFRVGTSGNAFKLIAVSTVAKTCAGFSNYLVVGNTTEGTTASPNRIRWSDVNNPNSWPANNYIDVEPDDSDGVIALVPFQASLYVFKKRSIHQIIITGLTGAEAFITRPVARGVGAYAKESVEVIPNVGIMFLGQNGIYLYDGSTLDLVSDNVQRTIDGISRTRYAYSVGAVYRQRNQYWLAYTTSTTNQSVLVYDYIQKAWTVYTGINANALAAGETSTGADVLLTGSNAGNVHRQDVEGANDNPDGSETAISAHYVTQDLHFNSPEIEKTFRYLYVFTVVDSSTTITVQAAKDFESSYVESYTFQLEEEGAVWDTAIWDTDAFPASANRIFRKTLDRTGKALRLKFSNMSQDQVMGVLGWTIVYELQDWKE